MSCYSQTETGAAFAPRRTSSLRTVFNRVVERLRVARNHRRQCRELIEYLASDHRAANDLGITIYEARNLCRGREIERATEQRLREIERARAEQLETRFHL
jgi:hypothetical protein